ISAWQPAQLRAPTNAESCFQKCSGVHRVCAAKGATPSARMHSRRMMNALLEARCLHDADALFDVHQAITGNVANQFVFPVGPSYLDQIGFGRGSEPEVKAKIIDGIITRLTFHLLYLPVRAAFHANSAPDGAAIALGAG